MPLERGAVYLSAVPLTSRREGSSDVLEKHVIVLQDAQRMDPGATRIACVVASTDRLQGAALRPYEVRLGQHDGFDHETVVDGRWVFSFKRPLVEAGAYLHTLGEQPMAEISVAVFIGLQLDL